MDKILPLQYITDIDPVPEEIVDASGWFQTEYLVYKKGGWPVSQAVDLLPIYMAQGWLVYDKEDGYDLRIDGGTTFYYPWTEFSMRRRKLQSEDVLQTIITDFTAAYNEGRQINDSRYDELVNLYDVMLDKTEDELVALDGIVDTDDALLAAIIADMESDYDDYSGNLGELLDDYGDAQRLRINTQFDNEVADAKQDLTTRGMYNSTVWTSTNAGIEFRRAEALTDLEDKILRLRADLLGKDQNYLIDMRKGIYDARVRLLGVKQDNALKPLELRNRVLLAMLAFMERRTDDYPGLDGLADIVAKLGYSDTPSMVVP